MTNTLRAAESSGDLFPVVIGLIHDVSASARQVKITPESLLLEELSLDSLDLVRVLMLVEDRFRVAIDLDEVSKMKCVGDLADILGRELRSAA